MMFALNDGKNIYHKEVSKLHERENFKKFIEILEHEDEHANLRNVSHIAKNKTLELLVFTNYGYMTGVHCFQFSDSEDYLYACNNIAAWSEC